MPQAPNQYDPYSHPEEALERRNLVLSEMKGQKYITAEQYESAINTPITDGLQSLKSTNSYPAHLDNYLKEVINQVEQETGYNLLTTGMEVYTNVDQDAQKRLWDIYNTDQYVSYPMICKLLLLLLMSLMVMLLRNSVLVTKQVTFHLEQTKP